MNRTLAKPLALACALITSVSLLATAAHAQSLKDVLDGLLTKVLGDKAKSLGLSVENITRSKSIFTGRSWTFRDAGLATAKVTAFANEICVEKVGTQNQACVDYNSKETRRKGYALMPNGTGETVQIFYNQGRIVVESDRIDCTTGLKVVWATSTEITFKNQAPIVSDVISTGGLGGCS